MTESESQPSFPNGEYIVNAKQRKRVDRAARIINARTPNDIKIIGDSLVRHFEVPTIYGPLGANFITSSTSNSAMPSILAYEPEDRDNPGPMRGYSLTPEGIFATTVENGDGEHYTQEQLEILFEAGAFQPTENEWQRFVKLMSHMTHFTEPMGKVTLKLISLFDKKQSNE